MVLQSIILLLKAVLEMSNGDNGFWFGVVDVRRFGFCWRGDYQGKIDLGLWFDLGHYIWWHMGVG